MCCDIVQTYNAGLNHYSITFTGLIITSLTKIRENKSAKNIFEDEFKKIKPRKELTNFSLSGRNKFPMYFNTLKIKLKKLTVDHVLSSSRKCSQIKQTYIDTKQLFIDQYWIDFKKLFNGVLELNYDRLNNKLDNGLFIESKRGIILGGNSLGTNLFETTCRSINFGSPVFFERVKIMLLYAILLFLIIGKCNVTCIEARQQYSTGKLSGLLHLQGKVVYNKRTHVQSENNPLTPSLRWGNMLLLVPKKLDNVAAATRREAINNQADLKRVILSRLNPHKKAYDNFIKLLKRNLQYKKDGESEAAVATSNMKKKQLELTSEKRNHVTSIVDEKQDRENMKDVDEMVNWINKTLSHDDEKILSEYLGSRFSTNDLKNAIYDIMLQDDYKGTTGDSVKEKLKSRIEIQNLIQLAQESQPGRVRKIKAEERRNIITKKRNTPRRKNNDDFMVITEQDDDKNRKNKNKVETMDDIIKMKPSSTGE
ncbi:uncharacterized protein LOC130628625 [Hydractinia symbiolongicarpus]|uniref:uncharacterized protein LOC130628625 n=1 Tax=Hydractinia symbiolongicarpus TaxID=13093 RepID=UPI00254A1164|nr:uncharacterized protein LOC130628625 [Hydractinia symbiolongicarpus]